MRPMPTATAEPISLRVKLSLPEDILQQYELRARATGMSLERLLANRLTDTVNQTSQRPIYLTDADRMALESQLSRNLGNAPQLIEAVGKLAKIKIGPATLNMKESLVARLRSRCPRNEDFGDFLERTLLRCLEEFAGLR